MMVSALILTLPALEPAARVPVDSRVRVVRMRSQSAVTMAHMLALGHLVLITVHVLTLYLVHRTATVLPASLTSIVRHVSFTYPDGASSG